MQEVDLSYFPRLLPLYPDSEHHMSLLAAAEGRVQACVWTDSLDKPRVSAACFGVRVLIGGDSGDEHCRAEVRDFLRNIVLNNRIDRLRHFFMLFWDDDGWQEVLLDILSEYKPVLREREYYRLDTAGSFSSLALPRGYSLRYADRAFLSESEWSNKRSLLCEMCSERVNVEEFLKHSFGVCVLFGNDIVGWCLSEYNNSTGCEVGIEVLEDHQRKGIGTALTLALVEEARNRGLRYVGWSCFKVNIPSSATACRAGFGKYTDYKSIIVQR